MKDIGKMFMENTKYQYLDQSDQQKGLDQPPLESKLPGGEVVELIKPKHFKDKTLDFMELVENRKSIRSFKDQSMTKKELSYLLWATQGVKTQIENKATFRTVPSAGARHAIDTYIWIQNVESLTTGLYRYSALEHKLIKMEDQKDAFDRLLSGVLGQGFITHAQVTWIWVADVQRMKWRYGQRGYRYLHLDAGHICQNLYLAGETVNKGTCAIAAFDDDTMNDFLDLDGQTQFVIYMAATGEKE